MTWFEWCLFGICVVGASFVSWQWFLFGMRCRKFRRQRRQRETLGEALEDFGTTD